MKHHLPIVVVALIASATAVGASESKMESQLFVALLRETDSPEEARDNRLSRLERFALIFFGTN